MSGTVICDSCGVEYAEGDYPFCKGGHIRGHGHGRFRPFDAEVTGMGTFHIDSMERLRWVESESQRRFKNGEKVAPTVFRQYSNDASNWDKNTLGRGPAPEARDAEIQAQIAVSENLRRYIAERKGR